MNKVELKNKQFLYENRFFKIILWGIVGYCILLFGISINEFFNVNFGDISGYPWGWEGGGLKYETPQNYKIFCIIDVILSSFVIVAFFLREKFDMLLYSALFLFCIFIVVSMIIN